MSGAPTPGPARQSFESGSRWEAIAGFSRALRYGDRILVSGITASSPDGPLGGADPAAQARHVLDRIEESVRRLGGRLEDVVRTRIYVSDIAHWEPVARVHGERFARIRPANTLVEAKLVAPGTLVEIEAEAVIGAGDAL